VFFTGEPASPEALSQAQYSWNYNHLVSIYRAAVGDRLILMPYELLRDSPDMFLAELEKRLGLSAYQMPTDKIYASLSPVELRWYPRISAAVRSLPLSSRLKTRVFEKYVRSVWSNRWKFPIKALQRVFPAAPVTAALIPRETVEYFRGRADSLKDEPLYAPYAADYLF
jgi:hypothetical protein